MRKNIAASVILVILCLVVVAFLSIQNTNVNNQVGDGQIKRCTRSERYKNLPEFDRALSLIEQRMARSFDETADIGSYTKVINGGYTGKNVKTIKVSDLWKQTIPCIYVEYSAVKNTSEAEGYFLFDLNKSDPSKLTIYVDESYKEVDDLLLSLLIVHETEHGIQFLRELNGDTISCFDKETAAFAEQFYFLSLLNTAEKDSITSRLITNTDNPQLNTIKEMLITYNTSLARNDEQTKSYNLVVDNISATIKASHFYIKQCQNG